MTDAWNEDERQDDDEETDVGIIGGGGPAATIDGDDETLDEHGENLREADPGDG